MRHARFAQSERTRSGRKAKPRHPAGLLNKLERRLGLELSGPGAADPASGSGSGSADSLELLEGYPVRQNEHFTPAGAPFLKVVWRLKSREIAAREPECFGTKSNLMKFSPADSPPFVAPSHLLV